MSVSRQNNKIPLLVAIAVVAVAAVAAWWYVDTTITKTSNALEQELTKTESKMTELLHLLERSEGDAAANAVIRDCAAADRRTFDSLLSRLDAGLPAAELDRLQQLYYQCGDFYAVRRHLMALRFADTVSEYAGLLAVAQTLPEQSEVGTDLAQWEAVADLERQKSERFTELVAVQGEIIAQLQTGAPSGAPSITALQQKAQELQESIGGITIEINAIKPNLSAL